MIRRLYYLVLILFIAANGAIAQINFGASASFKYLKGKDATNLPANWMTNNYIPSAWLTGSMPFRYGDGTGGTLLGDMQNSYSTVYLLSTFNVQNISSLKDVLFSVNFDDGFVVWINGEEVFSINAPVNKSFSSFATEQRESGVFETYSLPAHDIELKEGMNTIAIQGFNINLESSDFYLDFRMTAEVALPQTSDSLKVIFSKPNGFYTSPFDLRLDVPSQDYTIFYTIDGSNPQTSATAINGGKAKTIYIDPASTNGRAKTPCFIVRASLKKDGLASSFPLTQTYIFLDQVITQSKPGGDWPSGSVNGQIIDLEMDPDITVNSKYSGQMKSAMTDIPSISVVSDLKYLFNPVTGIYVNADGHGDDWERFCSVELIDPKGTPGFNINAGLRIRGGWSRHDNYPKHAFRLFFRDEYGAAKLNFPLFEDEGVSEFDKVDLRCEQNYSWANNDNRYRNTAVREVFSRDTQRDMGQPYTRSRYYHLYLNGMYWGLYQTQERSEARFAESYFGGNSDDYDVVKVNTDANYYKSVEATDGNLDSWRRIYNLCNIGFTGNSNYFSLEGKDQNGKPLKGGEIKVNIDNLIDYMQVIFYTGNYDAPTSSFGGNTIVNNFYSIDKRDDKSTGFIFFAHDAEHSMMINAGNVGIGLYENRVTLSNMNVYGFETFHPQWLHYKLTSNKEYRQRFADRAYKNFFNKGVFTPDIAKARFQQRAQKLELAIIGESARWGDARSNVPLTADDWKNEINDIYNRFFPYRTNIVIEQMRSAGLMVTFNPPVFSKNNVKLDHDIYPVSGNYEIAVTSSTGQILYTLDGTDPRMIGDQINSTAKEIASGGTLGLKGTAILNARVKSGDRWSALASVKFTEINEDYTNLKVTELHYHPTDSLMGTEIISGQSFEFIELKNTGDKPINLSGLKFSSAIEYDFKETDVLAPKQFYVIASKPKWFYERHFMVPSGNFDKNFANSGELVTVSSASGSLIISFTYSDAAPWPIEADGDGVSLSTLLRNPTGNPADPAYWSFSSVYDGTPFADDPGIIDSADDLLVSGNSVSVYPNPTKGLLYLKVGDSNQAIQVQIHSLSGSTIFQSTIVKNSVIDLGRLNIHSGIYLVNMKCNERNTVHKVIYQR